ncbi:MAG: putative selenate reductase subunit YgfK [Candidatus Cloacimonetes bacterium]|nr:putative selenate reductase subunit YgfK [Candidatus Cloacimonadota bacterium]
MSDIMRCMSFSKLIRWILTEYENNRTIFSIPASKFCRKSDKNTFEMFGERCGIPLGPAAGPNTQLAQNIITSYLTGGRFFELKTVQKMDQLEIEKPCIDVEDEGYNTEWSTELRVEQARDEYIKAWILIHFLHKLFALSPLPKPAVIFNMSVGYDLKGIKTDKIDNFMESLKDASNTKFPDYLEILKEEYKNYFLQDSNKNLDKYIDSIPAEISNSITLSTMHGCPPDEQQEICEYLLQEKNLHTFVKLNPTLLGYDFVSSTLKEMGFDYIPLKKKSFTDDMQYEPAMKMLKHLQKFAGLNEQEFGIKLTNTLPVVNFKDYLPGDEMYMSGKALFPLTVNLANKIAAEMRGKITISYSGGANARNIRDLVKTGIHPVTIATDILRPGGYMKLKQMAELTAEHIGNLAINKIDLKVLKKLAKQVSENKENFKEQAEEDHKIEPELPLFDCAVAPCTVKCPIHQDIPEYIRLVGNGQHREALKLITSKNPLPSITGYICPQTCALKCTRDYYENPLSIREIKKIAAENGGLLKYSGENSSEKTNGKVAIIGAGPAGLSAAYFLAKHNFDVTVLDKREEAGGTVRYYVPDFRLPESAINNDIEFIKKAGVKFEFGVGTNFSIKKLKEDDFQYIFLGIGASLPYSLDLGNENILEGIHFLEEFNRDKSALALGKNVAIIGGGNSAMDSARAATRIDGVKNVSIIYRRTKKYMPADREELENALAEDVELLELLSPVSFENGELKCRVMRLGEPDASGRKRPVPVENEFKTFEMDTVITAIGERVDKEVLERNGIDMSQVNRETGETNLENVFLGGDARRGPATVVEAIADGRSTAEAILNKNEIKFKEFRAKLPVTEKETIARIMDKKGVIKDTKLKADEKNSFAPEASRCLECNLICNRCVDVCPNRANIPIKVREGEGKDIYQILHLDALCNECGNCATFCPYAEGKPYKDKLTLFQNLHEFEDSTNFGFYKIEKSSIPQFRVRWLDDTVIFTLDEEGNWLEQDKVRSDDDLELMLAMVKAVYENFDYLL